MSVSPRHNRAHKAAQYFSKHICRPGNDFPWKINICSCYSFMPLVTEDSFLCTGILFFFYTSFACITWSYTDAVYILQRYFHARTARRYRKMFDMKSNSRGFEYCINILRMLYSVKCHFVSWRNKTFLRIELDVSGRSRIHWKVTDSIRYPFRSTHHFARHSYYGESHLCDA